MFGTRQDEVRTLRYSRLLSGTRVQLHENEESGIRMLGLRYQGRSHVLELFVHYSDYESAQVRRVPAHGVCIYVAALPFFPAKRVKLL